LAAVLSLLGACAQQPATAPEYAALEQRLQNLERRFDALERYITNLPSPPQRSRAEIEKNVQSLEAQRATLLERYTSAHPAVREVDLSLRLLRLQLEFLDRAKAATP
jgi:predicted  nucleic acid-binding Zn-ribbon protein